MAYEIKFYGDDPNLTLSEVRALLNIGARVEVEYVEPKTPAPEKTNEVPAPAGSAVRKPRAPKKDEPKQVDLEEAIEAKAAAEKVSAEPPKAVSKDELRSKLIELMNAKGEDAPAKLLSEKFDVAKIGELDPKDYAACHAAAVELLEGE